MAVYFVQAGCGPVKIGYATNVARRVLLLQTGCPITLRLIREAPGCRLTEAWLHRHFKFQHIEREWFRYTPEMLTVEPGVLRQWIAPPAWAPFVDHVVATHGVKSRTFEKWKSRGVPHRFRLPIYNAARKAGVALDDADFAPKGQASAA